MKSALALLLLLGCASCPIAARRVTPFGALCSSDDTCGAGYTCDKDHAICARAPGEGEGDAGEGEGEAGEGEAGEGEGEGEGDAGEGEGEGDVAEGEGEGEGEPTQCFNDACVCNIGESCFPGGCAAPLPICEEDNDCGIVEACAPTCDQDGCASFPFCNSNTTHICAGVSPQLVVTVSWTTSAELSVHMSKKDADGRYCMDPFVDSTQFGPLSSICAEGAPLDCFGGSCTVQASVRVRPHWDTGAGTAGDPGLHEVSINGGESPSVFAVRQAAVGDYVVGVFYFANGAPAGPTAVTVQVSVDDTVVRTVVHTLQDNGEWDDFVHIQVDAPGHIACTGDVTSGIDPCP